LRELHTRFAGLDLAGTKVLLDCANGATYAAAPEIFRRVGAHVTAIADTPDGRNINEGCGSTHVDALAQQVVAGGHDVGFAFDGEQSGHIIDTGFVPSGDGIASALLALEALGGRDLAARSAMRKLPQRLVNVRVSDRDAAMGSDELNKAVQAACHELEGRGRV